MNAANSSQTSLQAEQKAHEPSMEDILASIRKIIADDDALPLSRRAAPARPEPLPACDEPVAAALPPAAPAPVVPPPVPVAPFPTPAIATRGPGPLKPPPIPSLRELAQRLDELPASAHSRGRSEPASAPALLELRPSLGEPPRSPEPESRAEAPPPVVQPAPFLAPAAEPAAPKAAFSFDTGNFRTPPLSFQANVPPPTNFTPAPLVAAPSPSEPVSSSEPDSSSEPVSSEPMESPAPEPVIAPVARAERPIYIPPVEPVRPAPVSPPRNSNLPPARLDRIEPTMLSEHSGLKVGAAFEALAESALLRDPELVERMTREILRPMIKTWLDDNLPNVVERLVRAEIERVARGPKF